MKYAQLEWRDGHPYSPEYDDIYYSGNGRAESEHVFLQGNHLFDRWKGARQFVIAETGFGSGLNFLLTANAWMQHSDDDAVLHYVAIEKHPLAPDDIARIVSHWPDLREACDELLESYPVPVAGSHIRTLRGGRVRLQLIFGDVVEVLQQHHMRVDAWYLDGFSPATNPAMWSEPLCLLIANNSRTGATLSTYTCAGKVRRGLQAAGFVVTKIKGHGKKREMISATLVEQPKSTSSQPWYARPPAPVNEKSAVIVGAGLAGLTVAWALCQQNWRVTVVDEHDAIASGASGNPAAVLAPRLAVDVTADAAFYLQGFLHSIHQLDRLQKISSQVFWFKTGVHMPVEASRARKLFPEQRYPENFLQLLRPGDAEALDAVSNNVVACFPAGGWVASNVLCSALVQACGDRLNVVTRKVYGLKRTDAMWSITDEKGASVLSSPIVVLANASNVTTFDVTAWMPVQSVRGQLTAIAANNRSRTIKRTITSKGFVTPEHDGVHYAGATYDLNKTETELLQSDQLENYQMLDALVPGVFECSAQLTGRVGFRAVSEDRMPIVGPVPDKQAYLSQYKDLQHGRPVEHYRPAEYLPGLYVSTAHGSRGLSSCFLAADVIAALVSDGVQPVSNAVGYGLNPARFLIRKLKRALPIS